MGCREATLHGTEHSCRRHRIRARCTGVNESKRNISKHFSANYCIFVHRSFEADCSDLQRLEGEYGAAMVHFGWC